MNIKDFEKVLNSRVEQEMGESFKKGATKYRIEELVIEQSMKLLDMNKFEIHRGFKRFNSNQSDNKLYINAKYEDSGNGDEAFVEIQIHKSLVTGASKSYWVDATWIIKNITVKQLGDVNTFEDAYELRKAKVLEQRKRYAEKQEQERLESIRIEQERLENFNKAKEQLNDFITRNHLDIKEFEEMARKYQLYDRAYINGECLHIFNQK